MYLTRWTQDYSFECNILRYLDYRFDEASFFFGFGFRFDVWVCIFSVFSFFFSLQAERAKKTASNERHRKL